MPAGDKFMALMSKQPKSDTSFDKTFVGYIIETFPPDEENNKNYNYKVNVAGNIYSVYCWGVELKKGDKVPIVVPCNNWNKMYIDITPNIEEDKPQTICLRDLDGDGIKEDVTIIWNNENNIGEDNTQISTKTQHFSLTINSEEEVTSINWDDGTQTIITDTLS